MFTHVISKRHQIKYCVHCFMIMFHFMSYLLNIKVYLSITSSSRCTTYIDDSAFRGFTGELFGDGHLPDWSVKY